MEEATAVAEWAAAGSAAAAKWEEAREAAAPLAGSRTKNGALGGAYAHGVGGDERPCAAQMGAGAGAH